MKTSSKLFGIIPIAKRKYPFALKRALFLAIGNTELFLKWEITFGVQYINMISFRIRKFYPVVFIILALINCKVSLTRITPIDKNLELPSINKVVSDIINKDRDALRIDLICSPEVTYSNYKMILGDFNTINSFQIIDTARVQLRVKFPETPSTYKFISTQILFYATLGIFPSLEQTSMKVRFDLYDKKVKKILKSFSYDLRKREYTCWSTPLIGVFLVAGNFLGLYDDIDTTGRNTQILEPLAREFAKDLDLELNDAVLFNALSSTEKYSISSSIVVSDEESKYQLIREGVEKRLLSFGIPTANQNPEILKIIYQIFADEQRGLYSIGPKAGQLSQISTVFKISSKQEKDKMIVNSEVIDVGSGNILLKTNKEKRINSDYSLHDLMDDLAFELATVKKMNHE